MFLRPNVLARACEAGISSLSNAMLGRYLLFNCKDREPVTKVFFGSWSGLRVEGANADKPLLSTQLIHHQMISFITLKRFLTAVAGKIFVIGLGEFFAH